MREKIIQNMTELERFHGGHSVIQKVKWVYTGMGGRGRNERRNILILAKVA